MLNGNVKRAFPAYRRRVIRLATVDAAVLLVLGVLAPIALVPVGILIGVAAGWYAWLARPGRGRRQSLPPGPARIGTRPLADPDFFFEQQRRYGAVFKSNHFRKPMVCIVGLKEAGEFLAANGDSLRPLALEWDRFVPNGMARWMTGEIHDEYRSLLKTTFGARLLAAHATMIREEATRTLGRMLHVSEVEGALHPHALIEEMCFAMWAQIFFGITPESPEFAELQRGYNRIYVHNPAPVPVVHETLRELERLTKSVLGRRTPNDPPTVLSGMVDRQTGATDNPTTMMNLVYLMETTHRDVAGLVTWALKLASDHPEWLSRLHEEDPDDATPRSLANRMVSETLRLAQSEHVYRRVTSQVQIGPYRIPEGWLVRVCVRESHRDPAVFTEPDKYDPDRFLHTERNGGYAPFGFGDRTCTGETLTRLVARTVLTAAAQYEAETVADGPPELSVERHWAPSAAFRMRLRPRLARAVGERL